MRVQSDTRAQRALAAMRDNLYLNEHLIGASRSRAIDFLDREYVGKGRQLFGRGPSSKMLDEFRQAAGGTISDLPDMEVLRIICFATQRIRTYGNIRQLRQGRFKWAKIVADRGERLPICDVLDQTFFRVKIAAEVLDNLVALSASDQGRVIRGILEFGKSEKFIPSVAASISNRVVPESLTGEGLGIPPLHELCGCRVEGVDKEEVEG